MTFVILGHCCKDTSCLNACPQGCIHPTPGEPAFEAVEHLYIDPDACIDCSACVDACPAGAVKPASLLTEAEHRYALEARKSFLELGATGRGNVHRPGLPVVFGQRREPLRVAVVGAGTAAMYAVRELLRRSSAIRITVFEQSRAVGGLLRTAVSRDQPALRDMIRLFDVPFADDRVEICCGVRVGSDVPVADLRRRFDVVILAHGASRPLGLGLPQDPDVHQAIDIVSAAARSPGGPARLLRGPRLVIVGGGNVALDVVATVVRRRVSSRDDEDIRRIDVVSRSPANRPAFTLSALHEITELDDAVLTMESAVSPDPGGGTVPALSRTSAIVPTAAEGAAGIHVHLSFGSEITELVALGDRIGLVSATGHVLAADSVVCAAGFAPAVLPGVPLSADGTVSNRRGRVVSPDDGLPIDGLYVTGWAKRGARGGLGDNRRCARETVDRIVADVASMGS